MFDMQLDASRQDLYKLLMLFPLGIVS